jgi:3-oxoacyl-[acyl-carrier-protein] synthase II
MNNDSSIVISSQSNIVPSEEIDCNTIQDVQFLLTNFDTRTVLGKKGTRSMDKLTGLSIYCINEIMSVLEEQRKEEPDRIGIVVGSAQGSMDSIVRFTHETLSHDSPEYVNPALFPNTVMNCAAGQTAIWHSVKGPNATISSGELSSFAAIKYAISLLENNYADTLISGGIEELTEVNIAANTKIAQKISRSAIFSEASVFFVIEHSNTCKKYQREILAEIKIIETGFNTCKTNFHDLYKLIEESINSANLEPKDINIISIAGSWPQTKKIELEAVNSLLGKNHHIPIINIYEKYGNGNSSHNALQINSLITELTAGQHGLLIAQDLKGNIGVMIISKVEQL